LKKILNILLIFVYVGSGIVFLSGGGTIYLFNAKPAFGKKLGMFKLGFCSCKIPKHQAPATIKEYDPHSVYTISFKCRVMPEYEVLQSAEIVQVKNSYFNDIQNKAPPLS
jgi:hypothetical protein